MSCLSVAGLLAGVVLPVTRAEAVPSPWYRIASPNPAGVASVLRSVSCSSQTRCAALGWYYANPQAVLPQLLVESWNGTSWSIVSTPPLPDSYGSDLSGISCNSPTSCVAVGAARINLGFIPLVESWDGTSWSIATTPDPGVYPSELLAVSCPSPTSCVAVGNSADQTLVETWNGSTWSITPAPSESGQRSGLTAVSCSSSVSCVALGYYDTTGSLAESWDGTSWSVIAASGESRGLSCTSSTSCVAVGYGGIVSWNGVAWSAMPSPDPGGTSEFNAVSCTGPTSCVAVGDYFFGPLGYQSKTVVETWNGTVWSVNPSINPGHNTNNLYGVSCIGASTCVAVGDRAKTNRFAAPRTLVESSSPAHAVIVSPSSGGAGTSVTVSGGGFVAGETVPVTYKTGLRKPTTVVICSATVDPDGTLTCLGDIPPLKTAGAVGAHTITAKGMTSSFTAKTIFTLT